MQSLAVVKANNVVSHIAHCFAVVGVVFLPDSLHLQVQKESLHDGVGAPMPLTLNLSEQLSIRVRKQPVMAWNSVKNANCAFGDALAVRCHWTWI